MIHKSKIKHVVFATLDALVDQGYDDVETQPVKTVVSEMPQYEPELEGSDQAEVEKAVRDWQLAQKFSSTKN